MYWFDEVYYGVPNDTPTKSLKNMTENTPHTLFITFSGKKQTGKDTAAKFMAALLKTNGKRVAVAAFADPLKNMCIDILKIKDVGAYGTNDQKNALSHIMWDGFSMDIRLKYSNEYVTYKAEYGSFVDVPDRKETQQKMPRSGPMTVREVLQVVGTDIFRAIYDDVWAKYPFAIDWKGIDVVILTDCRFPNEKKATEEAGGVIIRLERSTGISDNHPSEIALDGHAFENVYANNGSFEDLENYVRQILTKYNLINGS